MVLDLVAERKRFQDFHLSLHLQGGQDGSTQFDWYSGEHKEAIAVALKACETTLNKYSHVRKTFLEAYDRVAYLQEKGYPGGGPQQGRELAELRMYYNRYIRAGVTLKQHLGNLVDVQRRYTVWSAFVSNTIAQIQEALDGHMSDAAQIGKDLKERMHSLQVAEEVDSKEERKQRKKKLAEAVEEGQIDYFPPLLASNATWIFIETIGGGMGSASLWARVDSDGIVQERVVRKDTPMHPQQWWDSREWAAHPEAPQGKVPLEYYCHAKAHRQPNGSCIVRPRKFELDEPSMTSRIYTDYCPLGDLNNLIKENNKQLKKRPEAWVWAAFSALVECGLAMETDCDASTDNRIPMQIFHRDLKPLNVFLDLATEDSWLGYPQAKVGDFGLAIETYPEDKGNPTRWKGLAGTMGYHAPEQLDLDRNPLPARLHKLLAHTNVWGVGRIMQDIVNQSPSFSKKQPVYRPNGNLETTLTFKREVIQLYSDPLLYHIARCLAFDPKSRPSFAELRRTVDKYTSSRIYELPSVRKCRRTYLADPRNAFEPEEDDQKLYGVPDKYYLEHLCLEKRAKVDPAASAAAGAPARKSSGFASS